MGLTGSAVANVGAQAVGAALFLRALRRAGADLRPDWRVMRAQALVGRDLIIRSALSRHESRGLHYTLDFPDLASDAVDTVLVP